MLGNCHCIVYYIIRFRTVQPFHVVAHVYFQFLPVSSFLNKTTQEFMRRRQIRIVRDHNSTLILRTCLEILKNRVVGATAEMNHSVTLI